MQSKQFLNTIYKVVYFYYFCLYINSYLYINCTMLVAVFLLLKLSSYFWQVSSNDPTLYINPISRIKYFENYKIYFFRKVYNNYINVK
jgi:hypothetical protein